jgi:hypothetical protein
MEHGRSLGTIKKPKLQIMGIEEGEERQTNGIEKLLNNIIPENIPNLEKERDILVQEAYRTPKHQDQKRSNPRHIISKHTI